MAYYKLVGGKHQEGAGKHMTTYKTGDVIKSEDELDKVFKEKFVKATGDDIRAFKKQQIQEEEAKAKALEEEERLEAKLAKQADYEGDEEDEESALGEDVTEEFDGAEEAGLMVFKQGRHYSIANADKPERAVRNGKEITKTEARAYIKEHAPDEEEAEAEEEGDEDEG